MKHIPVRKTKARRGAPASTRNKVASAVQTEVRQLVSALDERYRRKLDTTSPRDDDAALARTPLGGPGNFGGGGLDLESDR